MGEANQRTNQSITPRMISCSGSMQERATTPMAVHENINPFSLHCIGTPCTPVKPYLVRTTSKGPFPRTSMAASIDRKSPRSFGTASVDIIYIVYAS